jgi:hypothetical protein
MPVPDTNKAIVVLSLTLSSWAYIANTVRQALDHRPSYPHERTAQELDNLKLAASFVILSHVDLSTSKA